jgi:hypothetical protein
MINYEQKITKICKQKITDKPLYINVKKVPIGFRNSKLFELKL